MKKEGSYNATRFLVLLLKLHVHLNMNIRDQNGDKFFFFLQKIIFLLEFYHEIICRLSYQR